MLVLKNATYIHPETFELKKSNIIVHNGDKGNIEFVDKIPESSEIIDCDGLFVTKSFVIGHHHAYSGLATGMPNPAKTPQNFYEILKYVWWNLDKKLDKETIYASALITAMKSIKSGATFIIDHHASPFAIENSLDIIAEAFEKLGVSHLLCYEISDRDGLEIAEKGLAETERYLAKHQGLIGLHASFTLGDKTLQRAAEIMEKYNSGIHIHVAEDEIDQSLSIMNYGKRVIERLNSFGFLNSSKTIIAHALHINNYERELLAGSNAFIVQNPESNLNNKVGFFRRKILNPKQIFLGTDGMHSNMIKSAQAAFFYGQLIDSPSMNTVYGQLRNVHNYIKTNNFIGDDENNLIVFKYDVHTELNQNNFLGHFFYNFSEIDITHVISNGELIMKDKKLTKFDENEILKISQEASKKLWKQL